MRPLADARVKSIPTADHEPGSLLAQWKLLRAASRDRRLSRGDIAVLFGVVDNYHQRHGNSRAAHSFLAAGTGLSRRAVISSIKRLRALGYLEVARIGSGTRPTEYVPNWRMHQNFTSTSGEAQITAEVLSTSPPATSEVNAASPKPAYVAGLRKQGPAPPPPLGGPDEPPAAPARDSFDELWNVYGRKHERNKAKAEYQRLNPDPTLHARIVRAAAEWTSAYEAQGRPKRYWKYLHTWLAGECWLEDLPEPYEGGNTANPDSCWNMDAPPNREYGKLQEYNPLPGDRVLARLVDYEVRSATRSKTDYDLLLVVLDGVVNVDRYTFVHRIASPSWQFNKFRYACGGHGEKSLHDFVGTLLWIVIANDGAVGFEAYGHSGAPGTFPPAIGSSSPKADAGGEGAIEF